MIQEAVSYLILAVSKRPGKLAIGLDGAMGAAIGSKPISKDSQTDKSVPTRII
jgi:hypothetical protein